MKASIIQEKGELFRARFLGFRDEILGEMVEEAKYYSVRGLFLEIAEVVYLGYFSKMTKESREEVVLVPMPTSRKHIRERGLDHMDMIAREIERLSGGEIRRVRLLSRAKDTVQVGASEKVRRKQAKEAVQINSAIDFGKYKDARVVILDDVWTTGASLTEAGRILKEAGILKVEALAITKNRPRKKPVIRQGEVD
ncbi:ComF family protein [Candidatus Saccharibacteria bacterium]|nr:ComF family protein [Candidatus Saccharibacteria bacterium]